MQTARYTNVGKITMNANLNSGTSTPDTTNTPDTPTPPTVRNRPPDTTTSNPDTTTVYLTYRHFTTDDHRHRLDESRRRTSTALIGQTAQSTPIFRPGTSKYYRIQRDGERSRGADRPGLDDSGAITARPTPTTNARYLTRALLAGTALGRRISDLDLLG